MAWYFAPTPEVAALHADGLKLGAAVTDRLLMSNVKETIQVLIIESDKNAQKQLVTRLKQAASIEINTSFAGSIKQALQELQKKSIDIIFSALALPDSQGCSGILQVNQSFPRIPILAMGDSDNFEMLKQALAWGAEDYLVKGALPAAALERRIITALIRKKTEQVLAQQSENKTLFLANMSHEIRTPLNSILGMTTLLLEESPRPDQLEYLNLLKRCGSSLMDLINQVLDLSKIESGRMELSEAKANLSFIVQGSADILYSQSRAKKIAINVELDPKLPQFVFCDQGRLRQILVNLLSNAVKFTEKGGVALTVKLDAKKQKENILFAISDSGPGMSKEFLPKLFQNYSQEDSTIYGKFGGTGLGLALTKNFVELMQGRIWVESEKGVGTTFFVEVPLKRIADTQQKGNFAHEEKQSTTAKALNILVAEDNPDNQFVLKLFCKNSPLALDFCENGAQAVEKFKTGTYDIVLMDMQMPVLDGLSATREIRAWERTNHKEVTPVIALTANSSDADVTACINSGCNAFLAKPFEKDKILELIFSLASSAPKQAQKKAA